MVSLSKPLTAGVCALAFFALTEKPAAAQDAVKPYILFVTDTSGSMNNSTGEGPPSCGGSDSRLDHAKCAVSNIVNTYGDVVIGYGSFRQDIDESDPDCSDGCDASLASCDDNGDQFQVLVPILEGAENSIIDWNDRACNTCSRNTALSSALNPELEAGGSTPLAGTLRGAKRYWQGLPWPSDGTTPYWTGPGSDPIREDPLRFRTLPSGDQCRPYIVVLLTDGAETCDGTPEDAAGELFTTIVDGIPYRIETKPIGFGIAEGNAQIEAIAHEGGNPDDMNPATNEGFYATNETDISQALATIVADALRFETCNDEDDDCDLQVDEDFPLKGTTCDNGLLGECFSDGAWQCTADGSGLECILNNPGHPIPGANPDDTCNQLDDDCDGKIDEDADCTGCQPFELCDGLDNDCDGTTDEGDITRTCGTDVGICESGVETCQEQATETGTPIWSSCVGEVGPNPPEVCNGLDDDCDGVVDGLTEECWTSPANDPPWVGVCAPGTRTCPSVPGGVWSACIGEITPAATDPCDGSDNDCDGNLDEDFTPSDCSSTCGMGQTYCDMGTIQCDASDMPEDEVCDGNDNDCDGIVDEDVPDGGPCSDDGRCEPGTLICDASTGGTFECRGGTLPGIEICDCEDNDCDGKIDEEDPNPLCAPGASCVSCECAFPCEMGEFPCPVGRVCEMDFCLIDDCYGVDCPADMNGDKQECVDGGCVRSCDLVSCADGFVCDGPDGVCKPDNCISFPGKCQDGELCVSGECQADPCADVTCDAAAGQYCVDGTCIGTCAGVECPDGQRCEMGACTDHPCGENCPAGQVCDEDDGTCKDDPCEFAMCPEGQACNPSNGLCEDDPCLGITCPASGQVCVDGSCYNPDDLRPRPTGPDPEYVAPGGGGGCQTGDNSGGGAIVLLLGMALLKLRRGREDV